MHQKNKQTTGIATLCVYILLVALTFSSSCVSVKKISYFNDIPDSIYRTSYNIPMIGYTDPKIQTNDILQVTVQTLDPQVTSMMGVQSTSTFMTQGSSATSSVQGYLVDSSGFVELPLVGKISVAGMTITEARTAIGAKASQYYKDPVVNVKFANFTITILGDVSKPGQYTLASEKTSILDAIGLAGDLTITAKRDNVLVIREENGQKTAARLDLNSKDVFKSPYFYLRQRDIVNVNPTRSKAVLADAITGRNLAYITTAVSVLTLIFIFATR